MLFNSNEFGIAIQSFLWILVRNPFANSNPNMLNIINSYKTIRLIILFLPVYHAPFFVIKPFPLFESHSLSDI